jgi:hypothetical protein
LREDQRNRKEEQTIDKRDYWGLVTEKPEGQVKVFDDSTQENWPCES